MKNIFLVIVGLLLSYGLSVGATPLLPGVPISGTIQVNETIVFTVNLPNSCSNGFVSQVGNADLYVSRTESEPNVYSDCIYSFTCSGDLVSLLTTSPLHRKGNYFVSLYLDEIVYITPDSYTINFHTTQDPTEVNSTSTLQFQNERSIASDPTEIEFCVSEPVNVSMIQVSIELEVNRTKSVWLIISDGKLAAAPASEFFKGHKFMQSVLLEPAISTFEWNLTSSDPVYLRGGHFYLHVVPVEALTCFRTPNDIACSNSNVEINFNLSISSVPVIPAPGPVISGPVSAAFNAETVISLDCGSVDAVHVTFPGNTVDICEDVSLTWSTSADGELELLAGIGTIPDAQNGGGWSQYSDSKNNNNSLVLSHVDPLFSAGILHLIFQCKNSKNFQGNITLHSPSKATTSDLLTANNALSFPGPFTVHANEIQWFRVCIQDINAMINMTSVTVPNPQGANVETIASRVAESQLFTNYTQYTTFTGIPNMNQFSNWAYSFAPFPGCPTSYFVSSEHPPSNTFSVGMFYFGMYSMQLLSCDSFAEPTMTFSVEFSLVTDNAALEKCRTVPNPSPPIVPSANGGNGQYVISPVVLVLCFLFWSIYPST